MCDIKPRKNLSKNAIITKCWTHSTPLCRKNIYQTDSDRRHRTLKREPTSLQFPMELESPATERESRERSQSRRKSKSRRSRSKSRRDRSQSRRDRSQSKGTSKSRKRSRSTKRSSSQNQRDQRYAERLAREREYSNQRMYELEHSPNDPVDTDQPLDDDLQFGMDDL